MRSSEPLFEKSKISIDVVHGAQCGIPRSRDERYLSAIFLELRDCDSNDFLL